MVSFMLFGLVLSTAEIFWEKLSNNTTIWECVENVVEYSSDIPDGNDGNIR
jgi:hypothetical protein